MNRIVSVHSDEISWGNRVSQRETDEMLSSSSSGVAESGLGRVESDEALEIAPVGLPFFLNILFWSESSRSSEWREVEFGSTRRHDSCLLTVHPRKPALEPAGMAASHNQQLALAGTALTTATLSLVLSYFLLHRPTSTAAAAAQDATKPDSSSDDDKDKDKDDDDDKDKKRYETKREFYSPQTGIWETREVNDEDKNEFLFRVLDRKWPKSKDYEGHEDYVR